MTSTGTVCTTVCTRLSGLMGLVAKAITDGFLYHETNCMQMRMQQPQTTSVPQAMIVVTAALIDNRVS